MPAPFDRCVKDVKGKGKADNPYAVCRATMGTDKEIMSKWSAPRKKRKKGKEGHAQPKDAG